MLLTLPPEIRTIIWNLVFPDEIKQVIITSQSASEIQNIMARENNPGWPLLVCKGIREELMATFYSQTGFKVGNSGRTANQPSNISGFRKWIRFTPKENLALTTSLALEIELDEPRSLVEMIDSKGQCFKAKSLRFIVSAVNEHFHSLGYIGIRVYYSDDDEDHHHRHRHRHYRRRLMEDSQNWKTLQTALLSLLPRGVSRTLDIDSKGDLEVRVLAEDLVRNENAKHPEAPIAYTSYAVEKICGKASPWRHDGLRRLNS